MSKAIKAWGFLREDARAWWWHKQLRDRGDTKEARRLENEAVRKSIQYLKDASYFSIGRGGGTLHTTKSYWISGICKGAGKIKACILLGIPGYDSTEINDFHTVWKFTCSMGDTLQDRMRNAKAWGASVYNYE